MKLQGKGKTGHTIELSISPEMIERVFQEWEQEHPGRNAMGHNGMGEDEFATRMMLEIRASARLVP